MSLTIYQINPDLSWPKNCVIVAPNVGIQSAILLKTDTKLYVPVVTLSTQNNAQNNAKLLEQLKSGFKRTNNLNKYQSKKSVERPNQYLDYLIDSSFQGVSRLFVLSFEDEVQRTSYKRYYLPILEIKRYSVMIDEQNFFDQPVKNNWRT